MSLQQIQREMEREARIDRAIEKKFKKLLKTSMYKRYCTVERREIADALIVFFHFNLNIYHFCLNDEKALGFAVTDPRLTIFFLRSKNPHDAKRIAIGDIRSTTPVRTR